ncbi:MAG TPA: imidazoleglycerol-phosphate dehydratase HisB [Anaeromyxobacter sp.]|nr:imidazoleglycerol-phosphate dehydratase HisB [Anaeromyxobacter sp.]
MRGRGKRGGGPSLKGRGRGGPRAKRGRSLRRTRETEVLVDLRIGEGEAEIATGVPFFDHMLEQLARHGGLSLRVKAKGDLEVDPHHTVEDVGIGLGEALREAMGDKVGLSRYGLAVVPLDEALVEAAVDLSGRPHLTLNAGLPSGKRFIGTYDVDLTEDFLKAFTNHARICLHLNVRYGRNLHHVVEALFKATARALRAALVRTGSSLPSTKGTL